MTLLRIFGTFETKAIFIYTFFLGLGSFQKFAFQTIFRMFQRYIIAIILSILKTRRKFFRKNFDSFRECRLRLCLRLHWGTWTRPVNVMLCQRKCQHSKKLFIGKFGWFLTHIMHNARVKMNRFSITMYRRIYYISRTSHARYGVRMKRKLFLAWRGCPTEPPMACTLSMQCRHSLKPSTTMLSTMPVKWPKRFPLHWYRRMFDNLIFGNFSFLSVKLAKKKKVKKVKLQRKKRKKPQNFLKKLD